MISSQLARQLTSKGTLICYIHQCLGPFLCSVGIDRFALNFGKRKFDFLPLLRQKVDL